MVCHRCDGLIPSIDALHAAILELTEILKGLGRDLEPRYSTARNMTNDTVDEKTMASLIGVTKRTLGEHRRRGRLPGCWVRNGRRIYWMPEQTLQAWKRGIA